MRKISPEMGAIIGSTLIAVGSHALGLVLLSQGIYLRPPFVNGTWDWWVFILCAPLIVPLILIGRRVCRTRPAAAILSAMLALCLGCVWMTVLGPWLAGSQVQSVEACTQPDSNNRVHYACTCMIGDPNSSDGGAR